MEQLKTGTRVCVVDPRRGETRNGVIVTHHPEGGDEYTIRLDAGQHILASRPYITPLPGDKT